jgi:Zn-dependent peptidase ImmA (M78 family)
MQGGDNIKINRKVCLQILDWCFDNIEMCSDKPNLRINNKLKSDKKDVNMFGLYTWTNNTIYINLKNNTNLDLLIDTIIHEYVHHCQDGDRYQYLMSIYKKNMSKHPMEQEACNIAQKFKKKCYNQLFK